MMRINVFFLPVLLFLFAPVDGFSHSKTDKWEQKFRLDREPSTYTDSWTLHRWGGPSSGISKGWLRVASFSTVHGEAAGAVWRFENKKGEAKKWDGSRPSTVEFRVEVAARNNVQYGASFVVSDDKKYYQFLLSAGSMTTYRIELDRGTAKLFKVGEIVAIQESHGTAIDADTDKRNYLYFGDGGSEVDGTSAWEFVRWTNAGILPRNSESKINALGFERALDFSLFPDDARQWENYSKSLLITDMSQAAPSFELTDGRRKKGKWKVLKFKTDSMSGNMLSIYPRTDAQPVRLPLNNGKGKYAIYVGLSTAPLFHNSERSGLRVKLGDEADFRNLFNDLDWLDHKRDVISEVFYTVANLKANEVLELGQIPNLPAAVAYVRLVPVQEKEYKGYIQDRDNPSFKRNIATIDGHGMLLYNRATTASDIRGHLRMFENSDYGKWWFQVLGADLVNYPSRVGTLAGVGNEDFPRRYDEEFVVSLDSLVANKVNTLIVSRQMAREMKQEFHVMIRPQGWASPIPFEETFNSQFYLDNPQWRCVDEYGVPTMYMSYAVQEVRERILEVIKEAVELSDPDGVGLLFNRGMPLMLWEKPFRDAFKERYKINLEDTSFDDERVAALRSEIITGLLTDLRSMLDKLGQERGGKQYKVSLAVLDRKQNKRHGVAVEQWIRDGLVDEIAVPPGEITLYNEFQTENDTKIYPLITPWEGYSKPGDFSKRIQSFYDDNSDGVVVWDGDVEFYKRPAEPHLNQALRYIGHKELVTYWKDNVMPRPNTFRLIQMGDNEYSGWTPNSGF